MRWLALSMNVLGLVGVGLVLYAIIRYRTDKLQSTTFDYRKWKPIWKMQDQFTPRGFRLHLIGWCAFGLGAIISSIYWFSV